ncbi:DinB family protein [Polaromonas sp.]|uniref:DinB family protein n=1 Tax=Polaromonas sp. TaxID=1869339 RepID=UPI003266187C
MNPATLQALAEFPRQLAHFYEAVPHAYRHWAPDSWDGIPSETFTAIGQLCHVRDIEIDGYHVRLERMLHENEPVLASLDGYLLAKQRNYQSASAAEVLPAFAAARTKTLRIISALTPVDLDRRSVFEGYGELTLRSLVHYLCSHDQQHLAGLQWLLGKIDASRVAAPGSSL